MIDNIINLNIRGLNWPFVFTNIPYFQGKIGNFLVTKVNRSILNLELPQQLYFPILLKSCEHSFLFDSGSSGPRQQM